MGYRVVPWVAAALLASSSDTLAGPRVGVLVLPSRRPAGRQLAARAERVAEALASKLGGTVVRPAASPDDPLTLAFRRAAALEARGALDDAARVYDEALEGAFRSPGKVTDGATLVRAMVARASIALAIGQLAAGDALLARAVRADAGFSLEPAEARPTLRKALERVRERYRGRPPFRMSDVGDACRSGLDVLVVARALDGQEEEFFRIDGCRLVGTRRVDGPTNEARVAAWLASDERARVELQNSSQPRRPRAFYRRTWFWLTVAGVAIAATAGGVIAGTATSQESIRVAPHW